VERSRSTARRGTARPCRSRCRLPRTTRRRKRRRRSLHRSAHRPSHRPAHRDPAGGLGRLERSGAHREPVVAHRPPGRGFGHPVGGGLVGPRAVEALNREVEAALQRVQPVQGNGPTLGAATGRLGDRGHCHGGKNDCQNYRSQTPRDDPYSNHRTGVRPRPAIGSARGRYCLGSAIRLSCVRLTLPLAVRGISSSTTISSGALYPTRSRAKRIRS